MLLLFQLPPVVVSVNCVVLPAHTVFVPVIEATTGKAFTVSLIVIELTQPLELVKVYVMVSFPTETPVINPTLFIEVIFTFDVLQTPPVGVDDKVAV